MNAASSSGIGAAVGALLASSATLVCCVLPAVMVSLGAGAALAGLVSMAPQLVWLSANKLAVFGIAGATLLVSGALLWHAKRLPCPTEPAAARLCARSRQISQRIYSAAVLAYVAGAAFAFVLPWMAAVAADGASS